jgi:protein arginine N-methyltransferase 1
MRIEYHRTLIADRVRNEAFHSALARVIVPGVTIVADIGAGTGIMGFLAAKLGARRVYLYESEAVAGVAREIARRNRLVACEIVPMRSTEEVDPPRVDVVVSETLGNYPLEEGIIATLDDARRRFLRTGGIVIPARIEQLVAPVVTDRIHRELTVWDDVGFGLDFTPALTMSLNNIYVRSLAPAELLDAGASARRWDSLDLSRKCSSRRKGQARWKIPAEAAVFGFATWWSAELVPGISVATGPANPRTHWEQLYLPLLEPIALRPGDELAISIASRTTEEAGTMVAWSAIVRDTRGRERARQSLDLDAGYLP